MTPRLRLQPEAIGVGMTSQRVRDRLIERLRDNGIADERVLNAIRVVPRHLFIDEALATRAYEDTALPIGHGQTISQPWVVAKMTEALFADGAQPRLFWHARRGRCSRYSRNSSPRRAVWWKAMCR